MFSDSLCQGFGGADENNNVLGDDDRLPRKRQTFFIFTFTMVISHTAISCKVLLLGILLMCAPILSAHAKSAGKSFVESQLDNTWREDFQDKKQDPKKPEIKEVPKARKQLKPAAVKPKVKPVKIIRPKIKKH